MAVRGPLGCTRYDNGLFAVGIRKRSNAASVFRRLLQQTVRTASQLNVPRVVPELQRLALIVLPQPISVGAVERVWSTYGWIQTKLRNRLLPAKARKLVMVHCHLRMLRMQKEGKWEEDLLEWHEEDEMWEVREEGGEEDYDSDDEPLQTSRQRVAAAAAAAGQY